MPLKPNLKTPSSIRPKGSFSILTPVLNRSFSQIHLNPSQLAIENTKNISGMSKTSRDFPSKPSGPSAETRKPTTRVLLRSRNDAGKARFDGRMDFQLTTRRISIAVSPVTTPRPRRFALRADPAPPDTKRSAPRKVTKKRILPSPVTIGDVDSLRPRRETRTQAGRAPSRAVCADDP